MNFNSWNRFKTQGLTVQPELIGNTTSFAHNGSTVTIKIPSRERVGDPHDEDALAIRGAWNEKTGEAIYYHVHAVDVTTTCNSAVDLPGGVLTKHPNAYELIEKATQEKLNAITRSSAEVASSAFEYWLSLLRWVTGFHRIGREVRVGSESGWSTYLHDSATGQPVWIGSEMIVIQGGHAVTTEEWQRVNSHAASGDQPPMHTILLDDAKHCIDVGDYRRALVDLSVACEVYLRKIVLASLPPEVLKEATRIIEEANINQYVSHMFPALLRDLARNQYERTVKPDLNSLFARRNKIMHVAALDGATHANCERYRHAVEALFRLECSAALHGAEADALR